VKTPQGQHPLNDVNAINLITNVVMLSDFMKNLLIEEYFSLRESGHAENAIYLYVPVNFGAFPVIDLRKRVGYSELNA
jgi:hypothetical protein